MKQTIQLIMTAVIAIASLGSCSNSVSYSERLNNERNATNAFLRRFEVVNDIPKDTVFVTGEDAPYYRLDKEGNIYMQVINAGDRKKDKAKESETIYFRYTRYNLLTWYSTGTLTASGDNATDNMSTTACYFNSQDFTLPASAQWGFGLQLPLDFIGVEDSEAWVIVKSQYGFTSEISYVQPFLYHIRYFHSQI
ncbi:MAG: DUF4827 family protein [Muribaculaceae bacterium]|nr:DUF4827 family protein [Muribaculaceae bacterium]